MEETKSLEVAYLSVGLVFWLIIFIVIRWAVNKKFVSEKRIQSNKENFFDEFYKELQIFYHIEVIGEKLILRTDKIDDIVTSGKIIIEIRNKGKPTSMKITYHRKIKLLGYFIILLGVAFCYIWCTCSNFYCSRNQKESIFRNRQNFFNFKINLTII